MQKNVKTSLKQKQMETYNLIFDEEVLNLRPLGLDDAKQLQSYFLEDCGFNADIVSTETQTTR